MTMSMHCPSIPSPSILMRLYVMKSSRGALQTSRFFREDRIKARIFSRII
jgi:hypothetical protein